MFPQRVFAKVVHTHNTHTIHTHTTHTHTHTYACTCAHTHTHTWLKGFVQNQPVSRSDAMLLACQKNIAATLRVFHTEYLSLVIRLEPFVVGICHMITAIIISVIALDSYNRSRHTARGHKEKCNFLCPLC